MPTYDYICEKCGHQFEHIQSMKDAPLKVCPKDVCPQKRWGKGKVKRAVGTGAGLIFKGSGFYITDYRSEGYKASAKKDVAPATAPASTPASSSTASKPSEGKSQSPPAKSEAKPSK
ncbi:MAG: FmdB family zinc ribbon protein [Verrucomicrobiota bacterium]